MTPAVDLDTIILTKGNHTSWEHGVCVMELASYIANEPWGDHPACVSPVLGAFLRSWNDTLDNATRQQLKPYAARVIATAGDGRDDERAWMATDWLCRVCAPAFLDLAGLTEDAAAFRALAPLRDSASAKTSMKTLGAGRNKAAVAGDAAWDAAWAAVWDAAWAAAGAVAWDAARDAAWAVLKPTVQTLQASAFDLLDHMVNPS